MELICKFKVLIFIHLAWQLCESQNANLTETEVINAAFEEVAPCPCDLTGGACDINCCCDADCNAAERAAFSSCIPYLPGGQEALTQEYRCASTHFAKEDWFPLLCVEFEYNAFLGYYYDWVYKIASNLYTRSYFRYKEEDKGPVTDANPQGYVYGDSLKTLKPADTFITERQGFLTIPQPTLSGTCMRNAPAQFLKDIDTSCTFSMSETNICSSLSVLSQLYYTQSANITGSQNTYFNVREQDASSVLVDTTVTYKCANATYLSSYLKSTQVLSVDNTQSSLFNYDLPTNPNCTDTCGNDLCIDLDNLPNPDPTSTATGIPDCLNQMPSGPTLVNNICQNAVIDVDYQVKWAGKKVATVVATIIMADIPINNTIGGSNELTQKYKVTFEHNVTDVGTGSTDNFNNITDGAYERSGRVGYDIGKPLHSGSIVRNTSLTPPQFRYVNTNTTRQMALFSPTVDGLCANAGRRSLMFGEDVSTSCKLMLSMNNFTDCTALRRLIFNRLNALMPSDVLGRRGYNDPINSGYWVNVLRPDLSNECLTFENFPLGLSPIDNRTGICFNLTTGIHLDIMYGITGRSNSYSIYEILGSRISYKNSTWAVSCPSLSGGVCSSTLTQPFYVHSSVRFIEIPAQTPDPVAKYYETPEEDDVQLCPGDRCWDNLFYPFSGRYMSDSREYVFGMVSLIIIFFVGYLLVTRPWW